MVSVVFRFWVGFSDPAFSGFGYWQPAPHAFARALWFTVYIAHAGGLGHRDLSIANNGAEHIPRCSAPGCDVCFYIHVMECTRAKMASQNKSLRNNTCHLPINNLIVPFHDSCFYSALYLTGDSLLTFHQVMVHLCVETELLSGSPQGGSKGT